jgi:TolA-binding protein
MKKILAMSALALALSVLSCLPLSSSASASSTSGAGGKNQTTHVHNTTINQVQPSNMQQQQPVYQQPQQYQQQPQQYRQQPARRDGSVRNFAIKSYGRIVEDDRNGGGEHLRSLILLMESEGVERDEALLLIKRALRRANGNAEVFGNELENSI